MLKRDLFLTGRYRHLGVIRARRTKLNRHLMLWTLMNLMNLLSWFVLSSLPTVNHDLLIGLFVLTLLTWSLFGIAVYRRLALWNDYER